MATVIQQLDESLVRLDKRRVISRGIRNASCVLLVVIATSLLSTRKGTKIMTHVSNAHARPATCLDAVIPYHTSDHEVFVSSGGLQSIQKYVQDLRLTWIISASNDTLMHLIDNDQTRWLSEDTFSFSRENGIARATLKGWHFQQALKLLAPLEIHGLCNDFLVIDADVRVLRNWALRSHFAQNKFNYLYPSKFLGEYMRTHGQTS